MANEMQELKNVIEKTVTERNNLTKEERDKQIQVLEEIFCKGKMPKDAIHISDTLIEFIYQQAYRCYKMGNFSTAEKFFKFLSQLVPNDLRHIIGYAAAVQKLEKYEEAILAYETWALIDPLSPFPFFHLGDIYRKMDLPSFAQVQYLQVIFLSGQNKEYENLKQKADILIRSIAKQLEQKGAK